MEEQERNKNQDRDALDQVLDAALAKYAAVEPRAGLQQRILANLQAEKARPVARAWWRWELVVGGVLALVLVMVWASGRTRQQLVVHHPAVAKQNPPQEARAANSGRKSVEPRLPKHVLSVSRHPAQPFTVAVANPKLDQFPSLQPLSEEERILSDYVTQFEQQAELIARVNNEDVLRDREEVMQESQGTKSSLE